MSVSRYRKLNLIHAPNYCVDRLMYMSMNIIKKKKKIVDMVYNKCDVNNEIK